MTAILGAVRAALNPAVVLATELEIIDRSLTQSRNPSRAGGGSNPTRTESTSVAPFFVNIISV
jgi:hypothetical protein